MTHFTLSVFLDPASSSYSQVHSLTLYTCLSSWWAVCCEMAPQMRLKQSMSIKSPHKVHGQQPLYVSHKKEKDVLTRYSDQEKIKMTGSKTLYKVPKIVDSDLMTDAFMLHNHQCKTGQQMNKCYYTHKGLEMWWFNDWIMDVEKRA